MIIRSRIKDVKILVTDIPNVGGSSRTAGTLHIESMGIDLDPIMFFLKKMTCSWYESTTRKMQLA